MIVNQQVEQQKSFSKSAPPPTKMQSTPFVQQNQVNAAAQQANPQILVDWSTPFDDFKVQVLDNVVNVMYSGKNSDRVVANDIMNQFKSHPDAWLTVDKILTQAQNPNTKFFALQILDEVLNTRWQILPDEQKQGIRMFIIQFVMTISEDENASQTVQHLLNKLNATLISIVKHEWTTTWQNFIADICGDAKTSQSRCENALNILRLLSEEVFDFSKNTLLSQQSSKLKQIMNSDFNQIFQLCYWVLEQASQNPQMIKPSLVRACLRTFQTFLSWIPLPYIFDTELIPLILNNFLTPNTSRIEAIKCFGEIAALLSPPENDGKTLTNNPQQNPSLDPANRPNQDKLCLYFCVYIEKIVEITKNRNLLEEFNNVKGSKNQSGFENFARQIAMVIVSVIKGNIRVIEELTNNPDTTNQNIVYLKQCAQKSLEIMIQLSSIPEDELFKICLDFWHFLCVDIMNNNRGHPERQGIAGMDLFQALSGTYLSTQVYPEILHSLEQIMVDFMVKPKEVLVVIDENGEAVEEVFDDTETISVYETMRETLVYLTNIDKIGVDRVIQSRLDKITTDKSYFTFDRLNKLCWALGSISGCMLPDEENKFVVTVIKELLNLCEKTQGKSNKALVAADIMYVVGQFPRFLCSHWAFLKTVVKKLNEFMHEKHPGVQDMASETFLKISKLTKNMFITRNEHDKEPFVNELIRHIPDNLKDLEHSQKLMVYEGIGHMISVELSPQQQEYLVNLELQYVHNDWEHILGLANQNADQLMIPEVIKGLDFIIKVNTRVAESVGYMYLSYLRRIFGDLLKMYGLYSNCISNSVKFRQNEHMIKPMKQVRRDILKLIQTYIEKAQNLSHFNQEFLPPLQGLVDDYSLNDPNARDPEVLMLFATMMKKIGETLSGYLEQIIVRLGVSTLDMIKNDFISNPEFREGCFRLVENIVKHCTAGLFQLTSDKFHTIIMTILFAMKHEKPELMEIGLETMHALNQLVATEPQVATIFYQNFYLLIVRDVLAVITDYRHMSGFKLQGQILQQLLQSVDNEGLIMAPINSESGQPHQCQSNKEYVIMILIQAINSLFPNLNKVQIEAFVWKLFNTCGEWSEFKNTLRDLLVSMKSFASSNDDLYEEERKAALEESKRRDIARRSAIPGLIKIGENAPQQFPAGSTGGAGGVFYQ